MPDASVLVGGRYRLAHRIAAGGSGEVWQAVDTALERPVAVKLLRAEYADHPETLARFRAEALRAASLSHPAIAQVYDYGDADPPHPPFLVMEMVDGPSLAGLLASGPLPPARTMDVVAQTAAGLAAAHAAGLIHRDIKPANLLVTADGQVKITDFGIAHAAGSAPLTRTGMLVGTPGYLAPERAAGRPATAASDLYSLGIVAYECLSGTVPFTGTPVEVALAHRERPLPPLPPQVPGAAAALVADLTAKDPADRPASARQTADRAARLRDALAPGVTAQLPAGHYLPPAPAAGSQPPTLAEQPFPGPDRGWRGWGGRRPHWRAWEWSAGQLALAAAILFAAGGLIGALVVGLSATPQPHQPAPQSASSSPAARTVWVNAASLDGRRAAVVTARLRSLGLHPNVVWVPAGQQPAGTVLSVQPAGRLTVGSPVTVTAALRPPGQQHHPGPGPGHGHDHGHGPGQGEQGNGGG